jgi:orotidine-5'-phosphate decarboxylase
MTIRHFMELLKNQWDRGHFVCVGLDSDIDQIPAEAMDPADAGTNIFLFNQAMIKATKDKAAAFKPNLAFYLKSGSGGLEALRRTIAFSHETAPEVPVIVDCKDADIGKTNDAYAELLFRYLGADAITTNPYLGEEAVRPFLIREDKGIIILCRTSNPGAGEFQNLIVAPEDGYAPAEPLYMRVARNVVARWNKRGNCALVVGATCPEELGRVRLLVGDLPILIPGVGTQGGDVALTVKNGRDRNGRGMIINSSSGITFPKKKLPGESFDSASRRNFLALHEEVEFHRTINL